jgi:hypothetical protein
MDVGFDSRLLHENAKVQHGDNVTAQVRDASDERRCERNAREAKASIDLLDTADIDSEEGVAATKSYIGCLCGIHDIAPESRRTASTSVFGSILT